MDGERARALMEVHGAISKKAAEVVGDLRSANRFFIYTNGYQAAITMALQMILEAAPTSSSPTPEADHTSSSPDDVTRRDTPQL